jgi:hypothetical protein
MTVKICAPSTSRQMAAKDRCVNRSSQCSGSYANPFVAQLNEVGCVMGLAMQCSGHRIRAVRNDGRESCNQRGHARSWVEATPKRTSMSMW